MQRLEADRFLREGVKRRIIDVRSPGEYQKGHIPGAVNIPIFSDLERARVGTIYKQKSRIDAIDLGLEIVGPKLKSLANVAKQEAVDDELYLYCWRGGMRSEKMAWLFELSGLKTFVLEGGYKNYRSFGRQIVEAISTYHVIQGPTGTGKTEIIQALDKQGEQVIDLEGLANHKGSAFGGLGQLEQPTTQQFQNDIFEALLAFDPSRPVWLESESVTIGRVYLPEILWQRMNEATIFSIELPRSERIKNIVKQYGVFTVDDLCDKVDRITQKLGGATATQVKELINDGDLDKAVDILLHYYDKSYSHSASIHKLQNPIELSFKLVDPLKNAKKLLEESMVK